MAGLMLSFLAGVVATMTVIRLYPILKNSQLAELVTIALQNRWTSAPAQSLTPQDIQKNQTEKERAMVAGTRQN
ncbi:MAG TPA: hypothetical protein VFA71_04285 [Terriglobales bacterium]|nr:hypothetical protein [Terriglobales bacterium]